MEYFVPKSLKEVFPLIDAHDGRQVIAGGTDLTVLFAESHPLPEGLVDISRVEEICTLETGNGDISIGAGVTIAEIAASEDLPAALRQGAAAIGSPQIRNIATIGGNICNASPCGDTLSPLVALNASFILADGKKTREVPAEEFFTGPKSTVIRAGELLTRIVIPSRYREGGSSFRMIGKRNGQVISQVNCAVWLEQNENVIDAVRICFGSVAPVPLRCTQAEQFLSGKEPNPTTAKEAAALVREEIVPIDDVRATLEYRLQVSEGLFLDIFNEAVES
jgi:CO/xanthine dehydrogenase FAD-binding subunit